MKHIFRNFCFGATLAIAAILLAPNELNQTVKAAAPTGTCSLGGGAQTPRYCNDSQSITTSGTTITVSSNGGLAASFEEVITGSPATVSIVVSGCMPTGTCDTLDTYTTVANAIRAPTLSKTYSYFTVQASWTGGTSPAVQINTMITTARNGGSGGGSSGGGSAIVPSSALYNGAISAALNLGITTNFGTFANNSAPYWTAAPLYSSTGSFAADSFYYFHGAPSTLAPLTVKQTVDIFVANVSSGNIPIAVSPSGTSATFYSGCQSDHTSPTMDGALYLPQIERIYWELSGLTSDFSTNAPALKTALLAIPLDGSGLVSIPGAHPFVAWGFHDGIVNTGSDLMGSLLLWKASTDMAFQYTLVGDSANASTFTTMANNIASALNTTSSVLWDSTNGMFYAATGQNKQDDVLGSAYAVYLGFISSGQKTSISNYLNTNYSSLVVNGFVHQSPSNWATSVGGNQCAHGTGNYDDGEWAIGNEWVYYALAFGHSGQAFQFILDYANNSNPAQEWYGSSATGSSPNLASPMGMAKVATYNYPGAVTLFTANLVHAAGCGSFQAYDTFYGASGTNIINTFDNCLNGWQVWTPDTTTNSTTLNGNGQVINSITAAGNNAFLNGKILASANYTVATTFSIPSSSTYSGQVFARMQGPSIATAYYGICGSNVSNQCQIAKLVSGTNTVLVNDSATHVWASGSTHTMTLAVSGTSLTLSLDGTSILTTTDSSIASVGSCGFGLLGSSSTLAANFSCQ